MSTETMTAREFLAEQKRLADAATEGPWERGDRWHIQGADHCQCADRYGPLVEERRMSINGEMMLAHVHRREEPWSEYGILSATRGRGGFPPHVVVETTEYGTMAPADAEFIAASRTTVPRLIAALEAVLAEADAYDRQPDVMEPCGAVAQSIRFAVEAALGGATMSDRMPTTAEVSAGRAPESPRSGPTGQEPVMSKIGGVPRQLVPGGHIFEVDEDGRVDVWQLEEDFHNGPHCINCGRYICEHCNRDVYEEQCDGDDVIAVQESKPRLDIEPNRSQ